MAKLFTCILFLFIALGSYSQTNNASLSGNIFNELLQPAAGVTVRLLRMPDSAVISSANANVKGYFIFDKLKPGKYDLLITGIGYKKTLSGPYQINNNQNLKIPDAILQEQKFTLNEVVVRDRKNYVEVKADKTVLNIERNILAPGTSLLNVLGNAPGIKVNSAGVISMRAGLSPVIYVNGKELKIQGTDLAAFLQNLQSADVSQIELINNPPAKYGAAGSGGIINIIFRKGANVGFNGMANFTAGYGRFGKGAFSTIGNYRTKKLNIFGSIGIDYNKTYNDINTARAVNDVQQSYFNTNYYAVLNTPTYTYRLGTDLFLDSVNTLGFLIYGNDLTTSYNKATNTLLSKFNLPDSSFLTTSDLRRHIATTNYNINYQGSIGKHQTLRADADMTVYNRKYTEQLIALSGALSGNTVIGKTAYDTLSNLAPTRITNRALKVDYGNQLSKLNRFDAGIKGSFVNSNNDQNFSTLQNGASLPDNGLSSSFVYKEQIGAAYASFSHDATKFSYNAGLRVENQHTDANLISENDHIVRNYLNFFPSVQLTYKQKTTQYIFDYNRRIDYLDYGIVNPIIAYQDNYNNRMGNPYLQPAIINYLQFSYFRPSVIRINLYAQQISNFFNFNYYQQNDATKVLTATKLNLRSYGSTGVNVDLPVKVSNFYRFNLNADVSYQRFKDYQGLLNKGIQDVLLKINQYFNITPTLAATLYAQYESNTFYGVSAFKPNYYVSGGISKQFSKKASLTLNASDIFNTDRDRYATTFNNLNINIYSKKETQVVKLTFTYRFGKNTVKNARRHTTGNADEQRRINASGS